MEVLGAAATGTTNASVPERSLPGAELIDKGQFGRADVVFAGDIFDRVAGRNLVETP